MGKTEKTQCHAVYGMKNCAAGNVYVPARDKQVKGLPVHCHGL